MSIAVGVLGFVTLQRLSELVLAQRNTRRLLARGAVEVAPEHYSLIVALHAAWLAGLWLLAWDKPVNAAWLTLFILLQVCRIWVLQTLGERWTTRIIVLPGEPLVRRGPYRLLSHPNYAVVVCEIAVLPLVFGLTAYALAFSALNAVVLSIRIRAEADALKRISSA
ncbi:isoprenylcysteine carboxyl methyltransferase family protein [Methylorubrum extorquens]